MELNFSLATNFKNVGTQNNRKVQNVKRGLGSLKGLPKPFFIGQRWRSMSNARQFLYQKPGHIKNALSAILMHLKLP